MDLNGDGDGVCVCMPLTERDREIGRERERVAVKDDVGFPLLSFRHVVTSQLPWKFSASLLPGPTFLLKVLSAAIKSFAGL